MKYLLTAILLTSSIQANADSFGSMCVMRQNIQQCTFWQWNSDDQTVFVRKVKR